MTPDVWIVEFYRETPGDCGIKTLPDDDFSRAVETASEGLANRFKGTRRSSRKRPVRSRVVNKETGQTRAEFDIQSDGSVKGGVLEEPKS